MKIIKILSKDWFDVACLLLIPFILGIIIGYGSTGFHRPDIEACAPVCATEFEHYGC